MQIGPRYKKARYLGVPVFRKTQTQKYHMRAQRKAKTASRRRGKSEYGKQMLEKQKARYSYGVSSGQFTKYVKAALQSKGDNAHNLIRLLESRLDNVVLRAGFAPTRSAARQAVSHGHFTVNKTIVTIPSYEVKTGDLITIRQGSKAKKLFSKLDEELKNIQCPKWLNVDPAKKEIKIDGEAVTDKSELLFDIGAVFEFYTR